ncbi:MAG: energy transducer TonB [Chitinophagaceae bacterium]|nr:energy transducer TonB [Chitinophagaceae bacterium]
MEKNKILSASFMDILFEGRNKSYGAYELRQKYGSRLSSAIIGTIALASLIVLASFVSGRFNKQGIAGPLKIDSVKLVDFINDPPVVEPPPPVIQKPIEQPRLEMSKLVSPKVVKDELVTPDDEIKDIEELQNTIIGAANTEGDKDIGIVAPPVDDNKSGVIVAPKTDPKEEIFTSVQIQAKFPGGEAEWAKYISKQIHRYIDELEEEGKAGTCTVQFIVDQDGNISDVEVLTMKGTKLAEICANAIRKGPNWTPAENNGKKVKAWRKQPVTFRIDGL